MRKPELHVIRKRAARVALTERWGGDKRTPSKQVRVDAEAADLLARVPDRDRRVVASKGIREAAVAYFADKATS